MPRYFSDNNVLTAAPTVPSYPAYSYSESRHQSWEESLPKGNYHETTESYTGSPRLQHRPSWQSIDSDISSVPSLEESTESLPLGLDSSSSSPSEAESFHGWEGSREGERGSSPLSPPPATVIVYRPVYMVTNEMERRSVPGMLDRLDMHALEMELSGLGIGQKMVSNPTSTRLRVGAHQAAQARRTSLEMERSSAVSHQRVSQFNNTKQDIAKSLPGSVTSSPRAPSFVEKANRRLSSISIPGSMASSRNSSRRSSFNKSTSPPPPPPPPPIGSSTMRRNSAYSLEFAEGSGGSGPLNPSSMAKYVWGEADVAPPPRRHSSTIGMPTHSRCLPQTQLGPSGRRASSFCWTSSSNGGSGGMSHTVSSRRMPVTSTLSSLSAPFQAQFSTEHDDHHLYRAEGGTTASRTNRLTSSHSSSPSVLNLSRYSGHEEDDDAVSTSSSHRDAAVPTPSTSSGYRSTGQAARRTPSATEMAVAAMQVTAATLLSASKKRSIKRETGRSRDNLQDQVLVRCRPSSYFSDPDEQSSLSSASSSPFSSSRGHSSGSSIRLESPADDEQSEDEVRVNRK